MADNGYNPLRWDCKKQGCFNKKKRPKIEEFADCLPGKISFGDVDGIVELRGNFLILEFKKTPIIPKGQQILFKRLTLLAPVHVMVIDADIETMKIHGVNYIADGRIGRQKPMNLQGLKDKIKSWSEWAMKNPVHQKGSIKIKDN
jgi:hypothetical protein